MRGVVADINIVGYAFQIQRLMIRSGLWDILEPMGLRFVSFAQVGLSYTTDDCELWKFCQQQQWVLLTDNRNDDGSDSLQSTLIRLWQPGMLPVLTLANLERFRKQSAYARKTAEDVAELLCGIAEGKYRDRPRIFVPR